MSSNRSLIYNFFTNQKKGFKTCKTCHKDFKSPESNTANARRHLKSAHPDLYECLIDEEKKLKTNKVSFIKILLKLLLNKSFFFKFL